jgi:hypothetical protein
MRRQSLIIAGTAVLTAFLAGAFTWYISSLPTHRPDFAMMWQAMRQANPYDRAALNAALNWESKYPVAFVYPPTAMPFFGLLALLSMRVALTSWAVLSGAAMALAARSKWAPLLLLTPPVLWSIPGGQTSVLQGSILLGSLLLLRRPILAGVLLGVALCLKPQLALAFPLLLLIDRKWNVLAATVVTGAAIAVLSAIIFGPSAWLEWARSLPAFLTLHEAMPVLQRNEIAPGLPIWVRAIALLAGAWTGAMALRHGNPIEAFVIAAGAGLIGSAHAMGYEFAMLAATAPALIARRRWSASAIILLLMTPGFIWFGLPPSPFRLLAVLLLIAAAVADGLFTSQRDTDLASVAMRHDNANEMLKEPAG